MRKDERILLTGRGTLERGSFVMTAEESQIHVNSVRPAAVKVKTQLVLPANASVPAFDLQMPPGSSAQCFVILHQPWLYHGSLTSMKVRWGT